MHGGYHSITVYISAEESSIIISTVRANLAKRGQCVVGG